VQGEVVDLNRRRIIGGISCFGVTLLGGCITPAASRKPDEVVTDSPGESYKSLYFSGQASVPVAGDGFEFFNPQKSAQAKRIFDTSTSSKVIPHAFEMPTEAEVRKAINRFHGVRDRYQDSKELNLDQSYEVAQNIVPLLRVYLDLHQVTPSSRKAPEGAVKLAADGTFTIPPGHKVTSIQTGYCLDQSIGAPGRGEVMTLMPVEHLIPNELVPLYKAMQQKAYLDNGYRSKMQKLMWTLRSAGQPNSLAASVTADTLRDMDAAMPNGARTFVDYHNTHFGQSTAGKPSAGSNAQKENKGPPEYSILGLLNTLSGNGDKNVKSTITANDYYNAFLNGMSKPVTGDHPTDNRNYQMLRPGVASWTIGASQLTPQIQVINAGDRPIEINFIDWVAKPARRAQQVAMYPTLPQHVLLENLPQEPDEAQVSQLEQLKKLVDPEVLKALQRFLTDKYLKDVSQRKEFADLAMRLLKNNPAAQAMIGAMPILGNLLSLYEACSGLNWVTGKPLNSFERIAACLGVVPMAGVFKEGLKATAVKVSGVAFAGAGVATNLGWDAPVASYAKAYNDPIEFAGKYALAKVNDNLNQGLLKLTSTNKLSQMEKKQVLEYLGSSRANYFYLKY
jgi:hypothetical protein